MKMFCRVAVLAACLWGSSASGGDHLSPVNPVGEETKVQSLFATGPELSVAALRKENVELKAVTVALTKRLESLERRLSKVEKENIRLVSDEIQMPDSSPNPCYWQIPIAIERGMKADAVLSEGKQPPEAGTIIWGVDLPPRPKPVPRR